ncbi:MAG: Uma2 family endonuclease [Gemmatimonadaceae bacterium]
MPAPRATVWTPEAVRALPDDGKRYELIDGELIVTPAPVPRHQRMARELFVVINPYVVRHGLGELLWSPADISLDPDSIVQPDLFVVPAREAGLIREWSDVRALLLAIEILSPSTARFDRGVKRDYFQRRRVPEYWVIDLDARLIERWRPDGQQPDVARDRLIWQPSSTVAPLDLDVRALFAAAVGDAQG